MCDYGAITTTGSLGGDLSGSGAGFTLFVGRSRETRASTGKCCRVLIPSGKTLIFGTNLGGTVLRGIDGHVGVSMRISSNVCLGRMIMAKRLGRVRPRPGTDQLVNGHFCPCGAFLIPRKRNGGCSHLVMRPCMLGYAAGSAITFLGPLMCSNGRCRLARAQQVKCSLGESTLRPCVRSQPLIGRQVIVR